jgi:predicted O-methyltransferase YrrM
MDQPIWDAVDDYAAGLLIKEDEALRAALRDSETAGLPAISVSAAQGKLLHLLARMQKARRVLEIGTLGGYSTIWLARGLVPGGRVVTLELEPRNAEIARANIARAGVTDRVEIRVGAAIDSLRRMAEEDPTPFDLVFIDADKPSTPEYFRWAMRMSRPGTVIVIDNIVRHGALVDPDSDDPGARGMRKVSELIASAAGVSATLIQTVGNKGYDGFLLALVDTP